MAVKRTTSFAILVAFSLVLDRALNEGAFTVQFAEASSDATRWIIRSGDRVADTITGFTQH